MTPLRLARTLRDITIAALALLPASACGDKDRGTSDGASPDPSDFGGCLDSCGSVFDCDLEDPESCPEGQVCVQKDHCGCDLLVCEAPAEDSE